MDIYPKVLVIVLNYNTEKDTEECIDSLLLLDYSNYHIVLIDNNSLNFHNLRNKYIGHLQITIIENDTNLGFAKAHNKAIDSLGNDLDQYKYIALLNNDAVAEKSWLSAMVQTAETMHGDLISSKIIQYNNRSLLDNIGHEFLNTGEIVPIGFNENPDAYQDEIFSFGNCAAAALYSTEMIKSIGFFDPFFDTGYEDAELGVRAVICGYSSLFCPQAIVYHKISSSVSKIDDKAYRIAQQVNIYYSYIKLMPALVLIINLPFIIIKYILVFLVEIITLRWSYLMFHYETVKKLWNMRSVILENRRNFQNRNKTIPSILILMKQKFFLFFDIKRMISFLFLGKKSVFDKSLKKD